MSAIIKIADAELEIMRVLWSEGHAMTSTEIRDKQHTKEYLLPFTRPLPIEYLKAGNAQHVAGFDDQVPIHRSL